VACTVLGSDGDVAHAKEHDATATATGRGHHDVEPSIVLEMTLGDALADLSTEHREVLHHAYRDDLSQSQIAARLGVPLGTVKTRTYWALAAMRRALAPTFDRPVAA